jgi:hypothetical protein
METQKTDTEQEDHDTETETQEQDSQEVDHFQVGMAAIQRQLDPEVLDSFLSELFLIEQHYPSTSKEIQSCVRGLRKPNVTILDLLVASFVINKGATIKYDVSKGRQDDLDDLERLLDNINDNND